MDCAITNIVLKMNCLKYNCTTSTTTTTTPATTTTTNKPIEPTKSTVYIVMLCVFVIFVLVAFVLKKKCCKVISSDSQSQSEEMILMSEINLN